MISKSFMRITGGIFRGRLLKTIKVQSLRPTSERIREAVFNIIGDLSEKNVLDLYAGCGALGIEALSRGGEIALFVEKNRDICRVIRENLFLLGIEKKAKVLNSDVMNAIKRLSSKKEKFSVIFADPPYSEGIVKKLIELIDKSNIMKQDGFMVVEHSKFEIVKYEPQNIVMTDSRRYGDTMITIYRKV